MHPYFLLTIIQQIINGASALPSYMPIADQGVIGWVILDDQTFQTPRLTLNLTGVPQHLKRANVSMHGAVFTYGEQDCSDLVNKPLLEDQHPLQVDVVNGNINATIVLNAQVGEQVFSVLIAFQDSDLKLCCNWMGESRTYIARLYGNQVAGSVYMFVVNDSVKIMPNLVNGENVEPYLSWSIRKKWWPAEQDDREPKMTSCEISAQTAAVWYKSQNADSYLEPNNPSQIITVRNVASKHLNTLENGLLVLERTSNDDWQKSPILACARIALTLAYKEDSVVAKFKEGANIYLEQLSPFHPVKLSSEQPVLTDLAVAMPTEHNQSRCQANDASLRMDVLKPENLLPSKQASTSGRFSVVVTDLSLYGESSILMHQLKVAKSSSAPRCAAILPNNLKVAEAKFFYPIVGWVHFYQDKDSWESTTWIMPRIRHTFELKALQEGNWHIAEHRVQHSQEELACASDHNTFDPTNMGSNYCLKSPETCPIGSLSEKYGLLTIGDGKELTGLGVYATNSVPLSGPLSIIGNTLRISCEIGDSCANIEGKTDEADEYEKSESITNATVTLLSATFDGAILKGHIDLVNEKNVTVRLKNTCSPNLTVQKISNKEGAPIIPPAKMYLNVTMEEPDETYTIEILDTNNAKDCDSFASLYNPFYLKTSSKDYKDFCFGNPISCVIGDISGQTGHTLENGLSEPIDVPYLPLSDYYGVSGKVIRLKSSSNDNRVACALLQNNSVHSVNITTVKKLSRSDIKAIFARTFNTDEYRFYVKERRGKIEFSNCVHYTIYIAEKPNDEMMKKFFSTNRWKHFGDLWKSLRPEDCLTGNSAKLATARLSLGECPTFCIASSLILESILVIITMAVLMFKRPF